MTYIRIHSETSELVKIMIVARVYRVRRSLVLNAPSITSNHSSLFITMPLSYSVLMFTVADGGDLRLWL